MDGYHALVCAFCVTDKFSRWSLVTSDVVFFLCKQKNNCWEQIPCAYPYTVCVTLFTMCCIGCECKLEGSKHARLFDVCTSSKSMHASGMFKRAPVIHKSGNLLTGILQCRINRRTVVHQSSGTAASMLWIHRHYCDAKTAPLFQKHSKPFIGPLQDTL